MSSSCVAKHRFASVYKTQSIQNSFFVKTELSYRLYFNPFWNSNNKYVQRKVFERNSVFEIRGLVISEKNSDVKTLVSIVLIAIENYFL